MDPTLREEADEEQGLSGDRMSHVRWTICAMLFFATSINYMDRQTLANAAVRQEWLEV